MGTPRTRRSGRRGATLTVSTVPTKLAREQIVTLRGKAKASFLLVAVMTAARTLPVTELRPGLKDVRRPAELMHAYITLSLLCGLRTEEARALRWAHVDLDGDPEARPPVPPHVAVWNVRKMFRRICTEAGAGDGWTARELRTTFVSLMSHQGVSIEEIARLAGHATTRTTEIVYRRELRPVITTGAEIMDQLFTGT